MMATLALMAGLLLVAKWIYWRDIDRTPLPATRGAAVGLPDRDVQVFERPTTEANYISREMAFVVARRHALRLRIAASVLLFGVPLLAWLLAAFVDVPPMVVPALVASSLLAGSFVERWLFFAEAGTWSRCITDAPPLARRLQARQSSCMRSAPCALPA